MIHEHNQKPFEHLPFEIKYEDFSKWWVEKNPEHECDIPLPPSKQDKQNQEIQDLIRYINYLNELYTEEQLTKKEYFKKLKSIGIKLTPDKNKF